MMLPDPHLRRWMMFVDGENFTLRGQKLAEDNALKLEGKCHDKDVMLWFPGLPAQSNMRFRNATLSLQPMAIRSYYYTSATGAEDRLEQVRESLWSLGFQPQVFKRNAKTSRSKGVDIALAKDFLCNAFFDNYDVAVLIAGDGDYVPMVDEVKRMGKLVYVAFLYDYGLNDKLRLAADECFRLDEMLCKHWRTQQAVTQ